MMKKIDRINSCDSIMNDGDDWEERMYETITV